MKRGSIYFNDNQTEKKLVPIKNIKLVGEHNLSNVLCACLAVFLETKNENLPNAVTEFQGVEHRIEYVKTIGGVSFYNDSKATNIDSTLVAIASFKEKINLMLGGSDKGYEFDKIFEKLSKKVQNIAVFGETKQKILQSAEKFNFKNIYSCENLKEATKLCYRLASAGDVFLLSPACASFDQFSCSEESGNIFKKIVWEIDNENNFSASEKT